MRRATNPTERHLAALRKYAPFKALGSQHTSSGTQQTGEINALLQRWKPCPGDVSR
jgi:hypothetical protein